MSLFYRILLAWSEFDLAVARSTGRSPAHIAAITTDISRWELALFKLRAFS